MEVSKSSVLASALSLSVTTIGGGVLVLPSANQEAGIFLVLLVILLDVFFTILSIDYLVLCVDRLNLRSYEDIARELLGRFSEEIVRWILIVYTVGIAAGYILIVGEIFTPLLPYIQETVPFINSTKAICALLWAFVMLPLSCIHQINHIHFVSALAIFATLSISSIIIYRYFVPFDGAPISSDINYFSLFSAKSFLSLPIVMFSFDCQALVFQLYVNLKNSNRKNMLKVSLLSTFITTLAYTCVGIFGYLSFPGIVNGNILKLYDPLNDHLFGIGAGFYSITIIIAYCLVIFPCRDAVFLLLYGFNDASGNEYSASISKRKYLVVSFAISFISFFLAIMSSSIMFIIGLLGGLCSSTVCLIYPSLFRLALHFRSIERCTGKELLVALGMLCFGFFGGILGTYAALVHS